MTISSSEIIREQYTGNGIQKDWPVGFPFLAAEDLGVVLTDPSGLEKHLNHGGEYTVSPSPENCGGTVHVVVPDGWGLTIFPDQPFTQETDFRNNGIMDAEVLEYSLDKLTLMCLQLKESQRRSIQLADGDTKTPEELRATLLEARQAAVDAAAAAAQEAATAAACRLISESRSDSSEQYAQIAQEGASDAKEWAEQAARCAAGNIAIACPAQDGLTPAGGTAGQVYRVNAAGSAYEFGALSPATAGTPGIVRPDGKTSFVDGNGVLSAAVSPDEIRDINTALGAKLGTSVYDGRWWLSGEYAIVPATRIVCNHGLGLSNPTKARAEVWLVCKAAEYGYAVGDIIRGFSISWNASVAQPGAPAIVLEENSVSFCNGVFISGIYATQKNAGTSFVPTAASWRIVFAILK